MLDKRICTRHRDLPVIESRTGTLVPARALLVARNSARRLVPSPLGNASQVPMFYLLADESPQIDPVPRTHEHPRALFHDSRVGYDWLANDLGGKTSRSSWGVVSTRALKTALLSATATAVMATPAGILFPGVPGNRQLEPSLLRGVTARAATVAQANSHRPSVRPWA